MHPINEALDRLISAQSGDDRIRLKEAVAAYREQMPVTAKPCLSLAPAIFMAGAWRRMKSALPPAGRKLPHRA